MQRRRIWIAGLALALVLASVHFACGTRPKSSEPRTITVEETEVTGKVLGERQHAPFTEPRFVAGAALLTFLAVGDTGWHNKFQRAVSEAMVAERQKRGADLVLLLGDNFYREGVSSITDPQWDSTFEQAYPAERLPIPFLATLGNHDHNGSVQAQIDYTAPSTRWFMPARNYSRSWTVAGEELVEFFSIDTEPITHTTGLFGPSPDAIVLSQLLERSHARWKFVFGHHPARSHGVHGDNARVSGDLEPLFQRHGVDVYFSGHDHDLELTPTRTRTLQVVSGAGCHTNDVTFGDGSLFVSADPGFAWVGLTKDELWIVFVDAKGQELFSHRMTKQ